jgi:hypothetical protein
VTIEGTFHTYNGLLHMLPVGIIVPYWQLWVCVSDFELGMEGWGDSPILKLLDSANLKPPLFKARSYMILS